MAGSIVQQWGAENGAAGTTLATGSATVTSGNFLVIQTNSDTAVTCTITKNAGTATIGTITEQTSVTEVATFETTKTYTCSITGSGTLDLLATFGASDANRMVFAWEISGVSSYFGAQAQTDTGSNPTPTCTVTSVTAPAFAFMACIDMQGGTPGVGSGYTNYNTFGGVVHNGRVQYKAVSTSGSVTGNFANPGFDRNNAVLVIFTESSPPVITAQPVQQTVASGATATFSVTATDATSYQWQINVAGTWTNVSTGTGGTTSSYTTGTLGTSDNGSLFRCQVTNAAGTVNSAEVFLFLTNQPSAGKGIYGAGSAWARRFVRKLGNIRQSGTNFLRPRASRVPNKDNADLTTVWRNWFIPPPVNTTPTGTLNVTGGNDTLSAMGTPVVVGNLSRTNQNDTLASAGSPVNVGNLSRTNQNDTVSSTATPVVVGNLNRTGGNDTLSATGSVGTSADGTLNVTAGNDTLSSTGTPVVVGTLNRTNADDSLSSTATPVIVGNLSITNANDTVVATGSVGSASTGTLNVNEQRDTLASTGTPVNVANLNVTGRDDTLVATASPVNIGNLSRTEGRDTLTSSGTPGTPGAGTKPWRYLGLILERLGL